MQEATPTVPTVKRWLLSLTIQHAHEPILPWPHDFATLAFDSKSKWGWETPAPSTEGRCASQTFVLLFGSPKLSVAHIPIFNFPVTTRICTPKAAAAQTYVWMKAFLIRRFIHTHTSPHLEKISRIKFIYVTLWWYSMLRCMSTDTFIPKQKKSRLCRWSVMYGESFPQTRNHPTRLS